jgi:hypothetical protein
MNLKTLRLTLKSTRPVEESAAKLRGFFATRFNEYALLHQLVERGIALKEEEFGISTEIITYEFITPWIALSQNNYQRYLESKREQRRELLRRTLIGNILSASKGLDYVVLEEIKVAIGGLHRRKCELKGTPFIGFLGRFMVNFMIPDYMGLGKSVSRGFGTVRRGG